MPWLGFSSTTCYKWGLNFDILDFSEAKRPRSLETENTKLKTPLAEVMLEVTVLKDITGKKVMTPDVKRDAATHTQTAFGLSERRTRSCRCSHRVARYRLTCPMIRLHALGT